MELAGDITASTEVISLTDPDPTPGYRHGLKVGSEVMRVAEHIDADTVRVIRGSGAGSHSEGAAATFVYWSAPDGGSGIASVPGLEAALAAKADSAEIAAAVSAVIAAAPGALDTLNELAAALGDDPDFAASMVTALGGKAATIHDHDGAYQPLDADLTAYASLADPLKTTLQIGLDGGGSEIADNVKQDFTVPFNCTVTGWRILLDQSGSIVIDVWYDTYANYPPTVADSIAGTEKPTVSGATKAEDTALTTWTDVALVAGDTVRLNVDSCTTATRATLILFVTRT